jgi:HD-GYP domain-containing protein (c-di-GMP phosphodiesterase class II)
MVERPWTVGRSQAAAIPGRCPGDARILAVADVYEALTAERPYRAALPPDQVRAIMRRDGGRALCLEALNALEASHQLGVLSLATPATAAARPAAR